MRRARAHGPFPYTDDSNSCDKQEEQKKTYSIKVKPLRSSRNLGTRHIIDWSQNVSVVIWDEVELNWKHVRAKNRNWSWITQTSPHLFFNYRQQKRTYLTSPTGKGNTLNGRHWNKMELTQRMASDTETRGPDWQCPRLSLHQSSSGFSQPLFWSPAAWGGGGRKKKKRPCIDEGTRRWFNKENMHSLNLKRYWARRNNGHVLMRVWTAQGENEELRRLE